MQPVRLTELAEDWLAGLRVGGTRNTSRSGNVSNVERARRSDLRNWATSLRASLGRPEPDEQSDWADDLAGVTTADLTSENLLQALGHLQQGRRPLHNPTSSLHAPQLLPLARHPWPPHH